LKICSYAFFTIPWHEANKSNFLRSYIPGGPGNFAALFWKDNEMKEKKQLPSGWFYGIAVLVLLLGLFVSGWIIKGSGLERYPALIKRVIGEEQHHLRVPGSVVVNLTRTGAYGIYYENSLVSATVNPRLMIPPAIKCSLTSQSTGAKVNAVSDYIESNRYWSQDQGRYFVLIMSITIDKPDTYTFTCDYLDGRSEPEIPLALGPNYIWEFLKVTGKVALPLLGGTGVLCGSFLLAAIILLLVWIRRRKSMQRQTN
jgi:hypothetical protein